MQPIDPTNLRDVAGQMFLNWKVMVFYRKMTLKEYDMRRMAILELFKVLDLPEPQTTGWVNLRKRLRERDPDLKVPAELRGRAYRGKY